MFNEPHSGYIGIPSLNEFDFNTDLHLSHVRESIASNFADHTRYQYLFIFQLYSICFPIIPIGSWTSNLGTNMDTFIHYAN